MLHCLEASIAQALLLELIPEDFEWDCRGAGPGFVSGCL
jgi:hypothetical protein